MAFDARLAMLKQYFGYDRFLGGQEQAVDTLLAGRDLLAVMPTGAGKSICFQLPALCLPGITLVVSPLISLMADQVMALRQAGVSAAYLNRSLTERQYALALQYARMGRYKLIYVAPERLQTPGFLDFARQADISLRHCQQCLRISRTLVFSDILAFLIRQVLFSQSLLSLLINMSHGKHRRALFLRHRMTAVFR